MLSQLVKIPFEMWPLEPNVTPGVTDPLGDMMRLDGIR